MTSATFPLVLPSVSRGVAFFKTPKGILLPIFASFFLVAAATTSVGHLLPNVLVATIAAVAVDLWITHWRAGEMSFPSGAIVTGLIVAFVLRPEESLLLVATTALLAIGTKHLLRTHWSNIFNPAGLALFAAAFVGQAGESWWGALPDTGVVGVVLLLASGIFVTDRINKLPLVLAFLGSYFVLFTVESFLGDQTLATEVFRTPDLQAALFFAFYMLDDPPTCPIRYEDQVLFAVITATVAYVVLMAFGGVYYLLAGLLAANAWESGRRFVVHRIRR